MPSKLCECGCEQLAPIATKTNRSKGHVKGQPVRFINGHNRSRSKAQIFWKHVQAGEPDACWEWLGSRTPTGYGTAKARQKTFYGHRASWEIHNGPIPEGMSVLHKCDNPPCCNPKHLFLGTQGDNVQDMDEKGRRNTKTKSH